MHLPCSYLEVRALHLRELRPTGSPRLTRTNASGPPQHPTQPWRQLEAQARAETPWKCLSSAHKRVRTANAIMHGAAPLPSTRGAGAMSARAQTHGKSPPDAQLECAGVPPTAETHRAVPRPRFTTLAVDSWHGCRVRASSNLRGSVRPTRTNATALPSHPARPTAPRVNSRRGKDGRNTRELGTVSEDTSSFASATGPTPLASIRGARRGRYSLAPFSRSRELARHRRGWARTPTQATPRAVKRAAFPVSVRLGAGLARTARYMLRPSLPLSSTYHLPICMYRLVPRESLLWIYSAHYSTSSPLFTLKFSNT